MSRLSVSIVSAVAVLVAITGSAFAATSPEIEPAAAAAGDEVMFFNGCFEVVDEPPSEVQVALTQGDEQPDDESAGTLATLVDRFTYSFLVPEVQPGDYWVSLECAPGDWRTNLSEPGGAAALTVCEGNCVEGGLDILVYKYIDADGNLDTIEDQESAQGWEFGLDLTDGTIEDASPRTNVHGFAHWKFSAGSEGTTARVVELPHEGFELVGASCIKALNAFAEPVELAFELDGDSVTFQVDDPDLPYVVCGLTNAPSRTPAQETVATIEAWVQIDRDGDPTTDEDREFSEDSWEFAADFGAAEFVEPRHPVTKGEFNAGWVISYSADTPIVITVPQRSGYTLLDVPCSAEYTNVPEPVAVTVQGSSASWEALMADDGTSYFRCTFVLAKTREAASPTLPPTDTGGSTSTPTSDGWRVAFALLAYILAAALVSRDLGARGTASRRR